MSLYNFRIAGPLLLLAMTAALVTCAHSTRHSTMKAEEQRTRFTRHNLVLVDETVPDIVIDLRYRLRDNVAGKELYPRDMPCLVHRDTAEKLARAQAYLARQGYGLKIWDAWRPPSSHMALWYANPDPTYVSAPENGISFHCLGVAVDVTLVDRRGFELPMPSGFDDFSLRAKSVYQGDDAQIGANIKLLQTAMLQAGFNRIEDEWWHFVDPTARGARPIFARDLGIRLPVPEYRLQFKTQ